MSRLKDLLTRSAPSKELREALAPLQAGPSGLYEQAVEFVYSGAGAEILYALEQAKDPEVGALLIEPGRLKSWYSWHNSSDKAKAALQAAGVKPEDVRPARGRFYGSSATPAQFIRFGKLLAAVAVDVNRTVAGVPRWLTALLNDVTGTFDREGVAKEAAVAKRLPAWRAEFALALAAEDGVPEPQAVGLLALCQRADEIWGDQRLEPHQLPGMDDLLAAEGSRLTPELAGRLNADARAFLMERAEAAPEVLRTLAGLVAVFGVDSAKGVRTVALRALAKLSDQTRAEVLPAVLRKAPAARAGALVEWLGRDEAGAALLADAVAAGAKLGALVDQATARREAVAVTVEAAEPPIITPPFEPLSDQLDGEAVIAELTRGLQAQIARLEGTEGTWSKKRLAQSRSVTRADLEELVRAAAGQTTHVKLLKSFSSMWAVNTAPSLNLIHALRLRDLEHGAWHIGMVRARADADTDLRVIADALARAGVTADPAQCLDNPVSPQAAWPWFVDHVDVLEGWLADSNEQVTKALSVLACFPHLPQSVLPKVAAVALGDSRTNRPLAQAALSGHPAAPALAAQGLGNSKGEIRAAAADWLARQGDPAAVPALRTALAKEKRELPRAALLTALEALGDDISGDLAPAVLLAEAVKGLKAARPASLAWFSTETIPAARWADGAPVDPRVLAWWFVLAVKLKEPDGSGLIDRYLSRLVPDDAAEIGRHALRSWIAQDTRHPAESESRAEAASVGLKRWQQNQDWLRRARADQRDMEILRIVEEQAARTVEELTVEAYKVHQAAYLGSATPDKGLLALTTRLPGIELANATQGYIRGHGRRRAQVDYLVSALYANGQPAAVQLLLSISRRFKQATIQAKALDYVGRIADARGWTPDELADRTIPSAGFSEDRLLHLDFGPREFLGRVGPKAAIVLTAADGKPIKTLPAPRADDDEELAAEAKKQLTASRKELKAVLALQTARLYEAMCLQRSWAAADWQEFLASHPLMSQLITRLVWLENPGCGQRAFRPVEDGELIGADDEPIELAADARVGLAHAVLSTAADKAAWRSHLTDYKVEPLFDQFTAAVPAFAAGAVEAGDLRGHLTDTFSFRGLAAKRGYSRGGAEDGGWFSEYVKPFAAADLTAVLSFTGSYLPEENIACATETLYFTRRNRPVPLADVPGVLLAEAYADYAALAALGPYDPDYAQKTGG
ncbi:MAG: DUF4132 domain-containing protein [Propionibacteriaceae bacterium]|nr:DUF4132 domain-containing protein [Propionibacteriaceae bacterium]